jgi:hypothetical protein
VLPQCWAGTSSAVWGWKDTLDPRGFGPFIIFLRTSALPGAGRWFGVAMAFVALVVTDKRVLTRGKLRVRPHKRACRATTTRLSGIRNN